MPSAKDSGFGKGEISALQAKEGLHLYKMLLSVWESMKGLVHFELLNLNQTIIKEIYCKQFEHLKSAQEEN